MNLLGALYRRRSWVGVTSPKFQGKIPAVGSVSRRRTWGTRHHLEHLMRRYEL